MAMLAPTAEAVNPPKRGRGRPIGTDADARNPLDEINQQGYRVVGNMAMQLGPLEDMAAANIAEDVMRIRLRQILLEQERAIGKRDLRTALQLNREAQTVLGIVDYLDDCQGLDKRKPIKRAKDLNRDTAQAGREIIRESEPRSTRLVAVQ
jgi:hypothetical protein